MIVIDYRDERPLYEQIAEKLEHLIVCGAIPPHEKLPSVRSLALELSINPNTIQRAYSQLEQKGLCYTVSGRGNFVSEMSEWQDAKMERLKAELTACLKKAFEAGMRQDLVTDLVTSVYRTNSVKEKRDD